MITGMEIISHVEYGLGPLSVVLLIACHVMRYRRVARALPATSFGLARRVRCGSATSY
jgi:hypothetical protein